MTPTARTLIERTAEWPEEDIAELEEAAREIEAGRAGVYLMGDDERAALREARDSRIVSDQEMSVFWKRSGID